MTFQPVMDAGALNAFIEAEFPEVNAGGPFYAVVSVAPGGAVLRMTPDRRHLRPGGTVSGPTLFALADLAAYAAIIAHIGPVALAVTTNLNINFMRKPALAPLDGDMPAAQARPPPRRHRDRDHASRRRRNPGARDGDLFDSARKAC